MNFPRWVHPVHSFVPPEVLEIPRVAQSIDRARYFAQLSLSALVGGNLGLQVCLFPLVRSCSFNFHNDWYYVTVQLKRTCLLLVDKARHPPLGPFTESFWEETYLLGCEFEILGFQFFDLFQEIHALEKPRSIFWVNILLLAVFLLMFFFFWVSFCPGPPSGCSDSCHSCGYPGSPDLLDPFFPSSGCHSGGGVTSLGVASVGQRF